MPKLTPCPREDCTADVRHWHNHAGATSTVEHYRNDARDLLARLDAVRADA